MEYSEINSYRRARGSLDWPAMAKKSSAAKAKTPMTEQRVVASL